MALQAQVTGTLSDLAQIWGYPKVCEMVAIDYYKISQVPDTDVFTVTHDDLIRVGLFTPYIG